ncbi:hypothetical protein DFJ58DRAFT_766613 [Suillus subalutaceus]|uniref:uncharacterized protein n=1 Tax=Suillus subalutaceus TaxID=48586 RepID=UPI001B86BAC0|nr:uncharacterized protein DFJ58DRAFT_766613 [Suillus subalutaceus]KAG1869010.1 hypothetical protein DFJ58DRAFT_766613 [Suillus subalutaceus]
MGQTPSRIQIRRNGISQARSNPPFSESQSSSEPSTSVPTPSSSSVSEPQIADIAETKRSRRTSLPHRLLSSLAPRTSTPRSRTGSSATQSSQRKKWRLSRRISKSRTANDITVGEVAEPQNERNGSQEPPADVESGKGKAKEDEAVVPTTSGGRLVEPASDISLQPIPSISRHCSEDDEDEVVIAPTSELIDPSPQVHVPTVNQSEGPPFMPPIAPAGPQSHVGTTTQPSGRQFPPAGTLVVVQGVVHTTDVSRASEVNIANNNNSNNTSPANDGNLEPPGIARSSSIARQRSSSTPGDRLRNRLSGILPRPSSMLPSIPLMSEDGAAADYPQQLPVDMQSSTASLPVGTGPNAGAGPPTSETSSANTGSLSPSSIDVLGTLLSVAAAATAASLLTGTSEPIFSSGLAPLSQSPNQPPPQSMSDRPLSPTPTGDAGTLRDRLGLRTPGMGAPGADEGSGRPSPRDARELLLTEMARAFNLGLGLGRPALPAAEPPSVNGGGTSDVPIMPPPGSFERFLVDLQSDLRVALAQDSVPVDADSEANDEGVGDEDNHEGERRETEDVPDGTSDNESYDTAASDIDDNMPELQSVSDEASTISDAHTARESPGTNDDNLGHSDDPDLEINNALVHDATATLPRIAHADTLSGEAGIDIGSQDASSGLSGSPTRPLSSPSSSGPPGVSSLTESSTVAQESAETDMPFRIPRISGGSTSRTEHTPINWWRLYRFPAITAPASRSTQAHTIVQQGSAPQPQPLPHVDGNGVQNTGGPPAAPSSLPFTPSEMSDTTHATSTADLTAGVQPSNGNEQRNVVIPVIVVGLQSVHAERQSPMPPHPPHHLHPHVHHQPPDFADERPTEGDMMDLDFGNESEMSSPTPAPLAPSEFPLEDTRQSRGRSWQSRAADAIRNLRPGRRAAVARQTASEPPGSRTFLIYVIGGYYPPDHQIITGGNLDSFEALWELAELLGQVKPPTASKEEIDKSGLEVIKANSLEEYAKDGRVATNCVDRCLICLDDYVPDDDLRVLSCKHAFHQGCVDKWLQTGRNNCPACRTKGVDNETNPSTEASASSSTLTPQPAGRMMACILD